MAGSDTESSVMLLEAGRTVSCFQTTQPFTLTSQQGEGHPAHDREVSSEVLTIPVILQGIMSFLSPIALCSHQDDLH